MTRAVVGLLIIVSVLLSPALPARAQATPTSSAGSAACPDLEHDNRSWNAAVVVSGDGRPVSDSICESAQSRWYKVPVQPGQRVTAEVDSPPFDVTLAMFKDIQEQANQLSRMPTSGLSQRDILNLTAQLPREEVAPDATSPDATSPDATSPDATSPDATSPDATSPDATSPDATSPDATSPDATSPDATSPDPSINEQTYLAAQSATLLAYSDKPGTSTELVRRNTWDNTGFFYVRVHGHNGAFDANQSFTLKVTVDTVRCADTQLTRTRPSTLDNLPATPRTLILTNTARFPDGDNTIDLLEKLHAFAARPEIDGRVLDLKKDSGLADDYAQWDAHRDCVPTANIVVDQIHAIEQKLNEQSPGTLKYVVLAGSDNVIPFRRVPDEAGLGNEQNYDPAVKDSSESAASLELGYFLSQDIYGSFSHVSLGDHDFSLVDVPVGRLVENVPEIETMLSAYEASNGVIEPSNALVAGYDFMSSATTREFNDLHESGIAVDPLIEPDDRAPDSTKAWTADALHKPLLDWSKHYDIIDLNAHFSGNTLLAADEKSRIKSGEVKNVTDQRFMNSVVMSMGCHSGYNIVDGDAKSGTPPTDWAQAFAMKGATLVGGTGYQYGNYPFIKYSTELLSDLTFELRLYDGPQPGPVALGDAIVNVKRDYVRGGLNGIDEKSVSELTLYGLPMMAVNLRDDTRIRRPHRTPLSGLQSAHSAHLSFKDVPSNYQLEGPHTLVLDQVDSSGSKVGTTSESYFVANYKDVDGPKKGDVQTNPGQLVLPRVLQDVHAQDVDGHDTSARGVILWKATYTDVGGGAYRPLIDDPAVTERRGIRPLFASSVFTPTQIVRLSDLAGQTLVELPLQFQSKDDNSVFGTARRYDAMTARVYYSSRMDASALLGPPIIYSTNLSESPDHRRLLVDVAVGAAKDSEIDDVFATYTTGPSPSTNRGQWESVALKNGKNRADAQGQGFVRHYTREIPIDGTRATLDSLRVFIQAVGGNGLVSAATNNGKFFQLSDFSPTPTQAKHPTSLSLQAPADRAYRSTLPVQATLIDSTTHAPIPNKRVVFSFGSALAHATTGLDGVAAAELPVRVTPASNLVVTASFAEDDAFKSADDHRSVNVIPAATQFMPGATVIPSGGADLVATLFRTTDSSPNVRLSHIPVTIQLSTGDVLHTQTDAFGRVLLDTTDFMHLGPGTYSVTLMYAPKANDQRYSETMLTFPLIVS